MMLHQDIHLLSTSWYTTCPVVSLITQLKFLLFSTDTFPRHKSNETCYSCSQSKFRDFLRKNGTGIDHLEPRLIIRGNMYACDDCLHVQHFTETKEGC